MAAECIECGKLLTIEEERAGNTCGACVADALDGIVIRPEP